MTTMPTTETAKVYAFPAGGRDALKARGADERLAVEIEPEDVVMPVVWSCWYHEEAVSEADTTGVR